MTNHDQACDAESPETIPGVVDGLVRTSVGPDGSVSFHVTTGTAIGKGAYNFEFVLSREHADAIGEMLSVRGWTPATPVRYEHLQIPCRIGIRLNSPFCGAG